MDAKLDGGDAEEDSRTLSITHNKRGVRYKDSRDALAELVEDLYADWPLADGERTVLQVLERMGRDGMGPVIWCDSYLARKGFAPSDRLRYELRAITKIIEMGVTYGCSIVGSLTCFECLLRRW